MALVSAGPEPTTATPGCFLIQPYADAANPAETSWRQFTTRRPSAWAPAITSIMGPATTPKIVSMPLALSWRASSWPPLISPIVCLQYGARPQGGIVGHGQ